MPSACLVLPAEPPLAEPIPSLEGWLCESRLPVAARRKERASHEGLATAPMGCERGMQSAAAHGRASCLRPAPTLIPQYGQFSLCKGSS